MASKTLTPIEGKYEILEKLQERGMGTIYRVRHRLLNEVRAIKILRAKLAHDEQLRDQLLQEARIATKLRHPNIVQVHDFLLDQLGSAYIVMEFIDGLSLEQTLRSYGPPPIPLTIDVARQALVALDYLHDRGFVHRDVSPDNLMITPDFDGRPLVKLIDLGITQHSDEIEPTVETFSGKIRYAAPEILKGAGSGPASDLYSLGVVLYFLLTGQPPFPGKGAKALVAAHLDSTPTSFAESDPQGRVPDSLRALVLRMLNKDPQERGTAAELLAKVTPLANHEKSLLASLLADAIECHQPKTENRILDPLFGTTQGMLNDVFPDTGKPPKKEIPGTQVLDAQDPTVLVDFARESLQEGNPKEAEEALSAALKLDPRNIQARKMVVEVRTLSRPEDTETLQRDRSQAATRIQSMIQDGDFGLAAVELEAAVVLYGEHETFQILDTFLEHAASETRSQIEPSGALPKLSLDPTAPPEPEADLKNAASKENRRLLNALERAKDRFESGDFEAARVLANIATAIDPDSLAAQQLLALLPDELPSEERQTFFDENDEESTTVHSAPIIHIARREAQRETSSPALVDITLEPFSIRPRFRSQIEDIDAGPSFEDGLDEGLEPLAELLPPELQPADLQPTSSVGQAHAVESQAVKNQVPESQVVANPFEVALIEPECSLQEPVQSEMAEPKPAQTPDPSDQSVDGLRCRIRVAIEQEQLPLARKLLTEAVNLHGALPFFTLEQMWDDADQTRRANSCNQLILQGQALASRGRLSQGIDCFERALQMQPTSAEAWDLLNRTRGRLETKRTQRGAAFERGLAKIHQLESQGKIEKALKRLEALSKRHDAEMELLDLKERLKQQQVHLFVEAPKQGQYLDLT